MVLHAKQGTVITAYQLPALLHVELSNVVYLRHVPLSGHDDVALFKNIANDTESTQTSINTSLSLV